MFNVTSNKKVAEERKGASLNNQFHYSEKSLRLQRTLFWGPWKKINRIFVSIFAEERTIFNSLQPRNSKQEIKRKSVHGF